MEGSGSGSVPLTNGSGRPKNIRIRNTGFLHFWRGPCSVKILDSAWKCSERREVIFFTQIWTLLNYRQCAFILSIRILKKTKIKLLHLFIAHTRYGLHAGLGFFIDFFCTLKKIRRRYIQLENDVVAECSLALEVVAVAAASAPGAAAVTAAGEVREPTAPRCGTATILLLLEIWAKKWKVYKRYWL
jgi:hypothetical protein